MDPQETQDTTGPSTDYTLDHTGDEETEVVYIYD
jgi:hypothetical protein